MDSVLKLVYDDWPLANGINIKLVEEIKGSRSSVTNHEIEEKAGNESLPFRSHGNFLHYTKSYYPDYKIVSPVDISTDDSTYWYPIEIKTSLDSLFETHSVTIQGTIHLYSLIDTINPVTLEQIRSGKVKIVINYAHDPANDEAILNQIEQYFVSAGISGSNVYLITGDDCAMAYKTLYPDSKMVIAPVQLLMCQQLAQDILTFPRVTSMGYVSDIVRKQDLDRSKIRSKRFLCFNRSMRPHRYIIAYIALKLNLLENSIFSFLNNFSQTVESVSHNIQKFGFSDGEEYAEKILSLIPYELDTQHLSSDERQGFNTANNKQSWFSDSYIHLTSETRFEYGTTPFISEKTWKPISNLQPFIMIGNVHSLKYLKELGFKTFGTFIDESYDEETDYVVRMQKIYKEIEKLNNMPINALHNWYHSITDTLIHNQELLISMATINPYGKTLTYLKGN